MRWLCAYAKRGRTLDGPGPLPIRSSPRGHVGSTAAITNAARLATWLTDAGLWRDGAPVTVEERLPVGVLRLVPLRHR